MTRTSHPGRVDRTAGTVLLDALVAVLIISAALPAAVFLARGVIDSAVRLGDEVRAVLSADRETSPIFEGERE